MHIAQELNLDDALGGREGGQYEQRVRHHCSRHSLCNEARAGARAKIFSPMEVDPTCSHRKPALSSGGTALSRSSPHFSTMLLDKKD